MELGVQHLMLDASFCQHPAEFFRSFDGDGAYQYRLAFGMGLLDGPAHGTQLLLTGLIDRILQVFSLDRTVGRNLDDIHAVDRTKLLFLCKRRTGHAAFFRVFIEKVLERDIGQCLAFPLDLHMLFRLNGLMQTVRIPASRHDTSGKFIHNENLVVLDHIILVPEHQIVRPKRQFHIVLKLQILRICQVLDLKILLYLLDSVRCQVNNLVLLIDDKITGLLDLLSHNCIHFGKFFAGFSAF